MGSISFSPQVAEGYSAEKGDELGWFSYGGSTVITVFPEGFIEFDQDLTTQSEGKMEVLVRVGESTLR